VDDSGSDKKGPAYVLAGYVSTAIQWDMFSAEWNRQLRAKPRIQYFKMVEANSLKGEFAGWTPGDRDKKVRSLANVVRDRVGFGVSCEVLQADYDEVFVPLLQRVRAAKIDHDHKRLLRFMEDPYFFCFHNIIGASAKRLLEDRKDPATTMLSFVFDDQGRMGTRAVTWWPSLRRNAPPDCRSFLTTPPTFSNDRLVAPLQAADMIAWQRRRAISDVVDTDGGHIPLRREAQILNKIQSIGTWWDRKSLIRLGQSILDRNNLPAVYAASFYR